MILLKMLKRMLQSHTPDGRIRGAGHPDGYENIVSHNESPKPMDLPEQIKIHEEFKPVITIKYDGIPIRYRTPNRAALWRAQTLRTKEPCTIAWLTSMEPGSVLLDVGANVGMYSIFAAKVQQARVFAFEPESQNYALLNENIHANDLSGSVTAYCAGLSDNQGLDKLYLSQFSLGSSCHSLGEEVGFDLKPRKSPFAQGAISFSLDEMVQNNMIPVPDYIKIDVDGFEHKVLNGARETLANPQVKSIIIELNPAIPQHVEIVKMLNELGFKHSEEQVNEAARKEGQFEGVGEWIFTRRDNEKWVTHVTIPPIIQVANDSGKFANSLIDRIKKEKIETEPFPYVVIENIFPPDYYEKILKFFPSDDQMIPISETGRTGKNYRERLVTLFDEPGFSRLTVEQQKFWGNFGAWLYSPEFINGIVQYFYPHVEKRLREVSKLLGWPRVKGDALLVSDKTNYAIGPHTDAAHRLVTFLFYMPADDRFRDYGTGIYAPNDPGFTCPGGPHHPPESFTLQKAVPFVPNTLLMFVRTDKSFHGVEPINNPDIERHLLINNIRLVDA